jgi:hypothetical protein
LLAGGLPGATIAKGDKAMIIDPCKTWKTLEERMKTEKNPRYRAQLDCIVKHMKYEALGDIDGILTTLSDKAVYISYDNPDAGPRIFRGKGEIPNFYHQMLDAVSHNLEFFVDRLVVDESCVITEGHSKSAMKGRVLAAMGFNVDPDAFYLTEGRTLVVWPFDENGECLGEQIYRGFTKPLEGIENRKLRPEDIGNYHEAV